MYYESARLSDKPPESPPKFTVFFVGESEERYPRIPQWQIGDSLPRSQIEHKLKLKLKLKLKPKDPAGVRVSKKNVLMATASRHLRRVKASIEAAGCGQFP